MKKFLAILLAMMLALISVAALAEGETTKVVSIDPATASEAAGNPTKAVTVKIRKTISATSDDVYEPSDRHPEVTLEFTAEAKSVELSTETEAPVVTFNKLTIEEDADYGDLEINLPSYKAVGIYSYTVTEKATSFAGMHEAANLELKVTVIQNVETGNLEIAGIAIRQDDVKTDDIENIYKSGRLMVTKIVEGNMGDRTKEFPITITLKAPEGKTVASTVTYKINDGDAEAVTFTDGKAEVKVNLKHDDSVEIFNLPEGVTYTVVEENDIKHVDDSKDEQTNKEAYKVEGEVTEAIEISVAERMEYDITNTKDIEPDTGITLESLPYVLLMALAMLGLVALKLRRREEY
ncbi:MAG: hypothetical protein IK140_03330 [Clostridia bacterium]|nr:hypothetical protein [Clostridia bacterium]MBR5379543.1 hypothetical protein [Clostridia bacterium]